DIYYPKHQLTLPSYYISDDFAIFFFYCNVSNRHLHSFPTRRSSDLGLFYFHQQFYAVYFTDHHLLSGLNGFPFQVLCDPVGSTRSEEHTSELQSRENLVCRLLLEKKKQKQDICEHTRYGKTRMISEH